MGKGVLIQSNESSYFNGGNVGIGTTNPTKKLQLDVTTNNDGIFINGDDANDAKRITFGYNNASAEEAAIQADRNEGGTNNGGLQLMAANGRPIQFYTLGSSSGSLLSNTQEVMRISGNGNVGIGTTSPRATLNVTNDISNNSEGNTIPNAYGGNATTTLVLGHGVTGSTPNYWGLNIGTLYSGKSYLQGSHTNGSSFYDILLNPNGGKVGIGTTSPTAKLEVSGTARITGNLLMGGYAQDGTPSKIHIGSNNSDIPTGSDPALLYVGGDHDLNGTLLKIADYNNDGSTSKVVHFLSENNQDDYFFTPDVNGGKHYYRGNVGIGTTSPGAKLEVNGNIMTTSGAGIIANSGGSGYLAITTANGSLPGYPTSNYPALKTNYTNLYFSVGGYYSAYMNSGGIISNVSSKSKKENFENLDKQDILQRINNLNLERWNYTCEEDNIKRIGPYAEEFHKEFNLGGKDNTMIATYDVAGVSIVGIQALSELVKSQEKELKKQQIQIEKLMKMIEKKE